MATKFGLTWWGKRWIGALEALGRTYTNRLPRGRTYARNGSVTELDVAPGRVTARVAGRRPAPYRVSLRIPVFTDAQWTAATHALARQLRHAAALLDGRMPEDIDETLDAVGLSLFPGPSELTTKCSCPDVANPCKHVAAVHYILAQTFDTDPFLLPRLRGRDRTALLSGLRAARTGEPAAAHEDSGAAVGVAISGLRAPSLFEAAGDLAAIPVHPRETADTGAVLRRLGPPPGCDSLGELLDAVDGAATRAWRLAQDSDDGHPVLVALRERGSATTAELATALGRSPSDIRSDLRALVAEGLVFRTGHARSTRYHA